MTNEEREALIAQGWTPPVAVDPDLAEATILYNRHHASFEGLEETLFTAIKRGRELERAVMGNPIPEQIQEVTPPEPVNPDLAEAEKIRGAWEDDILEEVIDVALAAIKRGRALAAAEAKPGMVWVKHDGTDRRPVNHNGWVIIRYPSGFVATPTTDRQRGWGSVTHYAIITPPAEDVA